MRVFLSYSHRSAPAAARVLAWLEAAGFEIVASPPARGKDPSEWENFPQDIATIASCEVTVRIVTLHGMLSRWVGRECRASRLLGIPVVSVLPLVSRPAVLAAALGRAAHRNEKVSFEAPDQPFTGQRDERAFKRFMHVLDQVNVGETRSRSSAIGIAAGVVTAGALALAYRSGNGGAGPWVDGTFIIAVSFAAGRAMTVLDGLSMRMVLSRRLMVARLASVVERPEPVWRQELLRREVGGVAGLPPITVDGAEEVRLKPEPGVRELLRMVPSIPIIRSARPGWPRRRAWFVLVVLGGLLLAVVGGGVIGSGAARAPTRALAEALRLGERLGGAMGAASVVSRLSSSRGELDKRAERERAARREGRRARDRARLGDGVEGKRRASATDVVNSTTALTFLTLWADGGDFPFDCVLAAVSAVAVLVVSWWRFGGCP